MTAAYCLALALYFEARSEPIIGQLAVGAVIMNRVEHSEWPNTVCKVVWQKKQFSFTHDGKSDKPREKEAWNKAKAFANIILTTPLDYSKGSNHYHADYTSPDWAKFKHIKYQLTIGKHIFYKF